MDKKNSGCGWFAERNQTKDKGMRGWFKIIKLPVLEMLGVHSRTRGKKTPLTQVPDKRNIVALNSQIVPTVGGIDGGDFKP